MPNSLNTRLLRVTNEEENGEIITQIRPRDYDYNISYVDNFGGFTPYHDTSNTSDVRISYDYMTYGTTLGNSADARLSYSSLDSVSLKTLESLKEIQQNFMNIYFKFKYNKKTKYFIIKFSSRKKDSLKLP